MQQFNEKDCRYNKFAIDAAEICKKIRINITNA